LGKEVKQQMVTRRGFIITLIGIAITGLAVGTAIGREFLSTKVEVPTAVRTETGTVTVPVTEIKTVTVPTTETKTVTVPTTETKTVTVAEVTTTVTWTEEPGWGPPP